MQLSYLLEREKGWETEQVSADRWEDGFEIRCASWYAYSRYMYMFMCVMYTVVCVCVFVIVYVYVWLGYVHCTCTCTCTCIYGVRPVLDDVLYLLQDWMDLLSGGEKQRMAVSV